MNSELCKCKCSKSERTDWKEKLQQVAFCCCSHVSSPVTWSQAGPQLYQEEKETRIYSPALSIWIIWIRIQQPALHSLQLRSAPTTAPNHISLQLLPPRSTPQPHVQGYAQASLCRTALKDNYQGLQGMHLQSNPLLWISVFHWRDSSLDEGS